nr:MAG TPA: hypothetical protein [Bacteriophage sp.]
MVIWCKGFFILYLFCLDYLSNTTAIGAVFIYITITTIAIEK